MNFRSETMKYKKKIDTPCTGAMLIFSVSFQFFICAAEIDKTTLEDNLEVPLVTGNSST
jgi:dolichol kinase